MFCLRGRTRFSTASPAQPQAFADGLVRLLKDPVLRSRLASAKMPAQTCHSYNVFEEHTERALCRSRTFARGHADSQPAIRSGLTLGTRWRNADSEMADHQAPARSRRYDSGNIHS